MATYAVGTAGFNTKEALAKQEPHPHFGSSFLPESIRRVLDRGPKYAVEPRKSRAELLSLVRGVARKVSETESVRCVSEGVDVLIRRSPGAAKVPVKQVVTFLKDNSLSLLGSDKEGGFLVLPVDLYKVKAREAI